MTRTAARSAERRVRRHRQRQVRRQTRRLHPHDGHPGKINGKLPDVDTARLCKRLDEMPAATRQCVSRQMADLSDSTKDCFAATDVEAPGAKTAKLIEVTGSGGKRALRALADGNRRAADALLKLHDDVATQRAMVPAWERGDVSTKELATALRRYDGIDDTEQAALCQTERQASSTVTSSVAPSRRRRVRRRRRRGGGTSQSSARRGPSGPCGSARPRRPGLARQRPGGRT